MKMVPSLFVPKPLAGRAVAWSVARFWWPLGVLVLLAGGCCTPSQSGKSSATDPPKTIRPCPEQAPAPPLLPQERPLHRLAAFWIAKHPDPDTVLLSPAGVAQHNQAIQQVTHKGKLTGRWQLDQLAFGPDQLHRLLHAKLDHLARGVARGKRVLRDGRSAGPLLQQLTTISDQARPVDEIRVVHQSTPLRCFPTTEGIYETAWDLAFDLAQCSQLRVGEPVRVVATTPDLWYVWSTYTDGWVTPQALTPALSAEQARQYLHPEQQVVVEVSRLPLWSHPEGGDLLNVVRLGVHLPLKQTTPQGFQVEIPTSRGLELAWITDRQGASAEHASLTFRALLTRAFSLLNAPYGWGGMGQRRDCSRMLMDLWSSFGLWLPRNSWNQSQAGIRRVEVKDLSDQEKTAAIRKAAARGIVLLYLPGHIMLYVGEDQGQPYAFHLFSGYLVPCAQRGETMMRANRAAVTSLDLGRGTSRRAFIQRITQLVVFEEPGATPPAGSGPPGSASAPLR